MNGQALPQAPQLLRSVARLLSQPLVAEKSQLAKPMLQAPMSQVPPLQALVAFCSGGQALPHVPQVTRSSAGWGSQPLSTRASQSAKPLLHRPTTHAPVLHTEVPLATVPQVFPQAPQLNGSVVRSTQLRLQQVWAAPMPAQSTSLLQAFTQAGTPAF